MMWCLVMLRNLCAGASVYWRTLSWRHSHPFLLRRRKRFLCACRTSSSTMLPSSRLATWPRPTRKVTVAPATRTVNFCSLKRSLSPSAPLPWRLCAPCWKRSPSTYPVVFVIDDDGNGEAGVLNRCCGDGWLALHVSQFRVLHVSCESVRLDVRVWLLVDGAPCWTIHGCVCVASRPVTGPVTLVAWRGAQICNWSFCFSMRAPIRYKSYSWYPFDVVSLKKKMSLKCRQPFAWRDLHVCISLSLGITNKVQNCLEFDENWYLTFKCLSQ